VSPNSCPRWRVPLSDLPERKNRSREPIERADLERARSDFPEAGRRRGKRAKLIETRFHVFTSSGAGDPGFLARGFRGREAEDLKTELEAARLEGCAGYSREASCIPPAIQPRFFKYSFSHTGRPRVHLLPAVSTPQPPSSGDITLRITR